MSSNPRVNPYAVPAGGWKFPVDATFVSAVTKEDLAFQIISYRRTHGQPVGNPEAEIDAYFCERNPPDCLGAASAFFTPSAAVSLLSRVQAWAESFTVVPVEPLVDRGEADRRASTGCVGCPMNQPYGACCGSQRLSGKLAGLTSRMRGGQDVTRNSDALYGCTALGADTRTLVWLAVNQLHLDPTSDFSALPERCWLPLSLLDFVDPAQPPEIPNYP